MAKIRYIVKDCDHLPMLAAVSGYRDWRTLWQQNTSLHDIRKNPLILFHGDKNVGGDILWIQDASEKQESGSTDAHHPFKTTSDKLYLKLRVLDEQLQPVPSDATYELYISGRKYEDKIKPGGMISLEIPRDARQGKLVVSYTVKNIEQKDPPWPAVIKGRPGPDGSMADTQPADTGKSPPPVPMKPPQGFIRPSDKVPPPVPPKPQGGFKVPENVPQSEGSPTSKISVEFPLEIGRIDPIQEPAPNPQCIAGVQQRLNNLGYDSGPIDGTRGPLTRAAIQRFQRRFHLPVDGVSGPDFQKALHDFHDQPGQAPDEQARPQPTVVAMGQGSPSSSVQASQGSGQDGSEEQLSGAYWVNWAKTNGPADSTKIEDLASPFKENLQDFLKALRDAGAAIVVRSTQRSKKCAYLYHWSWLIDQDKCQASAAQPMEGVPIKWDHGDGQKSKSAAHEMVSQFGLSVPPANKDAPALNSLHLVGRAIDMQVTWSGDLKIKRKGAVVDTVIKSFPKNGAGNADLHAIAKTYGVIKRVTDAPHWSDTGQ